MAKVHESIDQFLRAPSFGAGLAAGAADMTEEQKQALMPLNAEFDHIQLADQTGSTIPPNSLGQKGGVPYFGNTPFGEAPFQYFSKSILDVTTGPYAWSKNPLASFDLTEEMVQGGDSLYFYLEAEFGIQYSGIAPGPGYCFLCLVPEDYLAAFTTNPVANSVFLITADYAETSTKPLCLIKANIICSFQEAAGQISMDFAPFPGQVTMEVTDWDGIFAADGSKTYMQVGGTDYSAGTATATPVGQPKKLYLFFASLTGGTAGSFSVSGKFRMTPYNLTDLVLP